MKATLKQQDYRLPDGAMVASLNKEDRPTLSDDETEFFFGKPSREQRLQALLEEYEALGAGFYGHSFAPDKFIKHYEQNLGWAEENPSVAGADKATQIIRRYDAARRYIIARDFNEFRDGHWQMLFKLTYGGSL